MGARDKKKGSSGPKGRNLLFEPLELICIGFDQDPFDPAGPAGNNLQTGFGDRQLSGQKLDTRFVCSAAHGRGGDF